MLLTPIWFLASGLVYRYGSRQDVERGVPAPESESQQRCRDLIVGPSRQGSRHRRGGGDGGDWGTALR